MRVDVKKCLILGSIRQKSRFFIEMQHLGVAEFIGESDRGFEVPIEIQNLTDALHILRHMVPVKQAATEDYLSARSVAAAAIEHNERMEQLKERRRILEKEIARLEPFGDFSVAQLKKIEQETGWVFQFFCCKAEAIDRVPSELIFLSYTHELNYYLSFTRQPLHFTGFIEMAIEQSPGELRHQLAELDRELDRLEAKLSVLAYQKNLLKKGLIDALNHYHLKAAGQTAEALLEQHLFAVEAWIPKNKIGAVKELTDRLGLVLECVAIEKQDQRPTYLENRRFAKLGEDLIDVYDVPSTQDRDPSLWVFVAFGLFFSMIVADAGYGLLMLIAALWMLKKQEKNNGLGRRILLLMLSLSIGCIFWGAMVTSFFNVPVSPNNPIRKISIIHWAVEQKAAYLMKHRENETYQELVHSHPELVRAQTPQQFLTSVVSDTDGGQHFVIYDRFTDNVLIELSMFIGVVHIILSFLRYLDRHWAAFGWVLFLLGGYLYFPSILHATSFIYYLFGIPQQGSPEVGLVMLISGVGLAAILACCQYRLKGLGEVMHVIQVFSDVMSYLRIYALSLAGMIMGSTFDHIGTSMPLYIGVFILIIGHTVNFTLALMGGVIHGLRLNFIEWYHYSFEGGGRKFSPLALLRLD